MAAARGRGGRATSRRCGRRRRAARAGSCSPAARPSRLASRSTRRSAGRSAPCWRRRCRASARRAAARRRRGAAAARAPPSADCRRKAATGWPGGRRARIAAADRSTARRPHAGEPAAPRSPGRARPAASNVILSAIAQPEGEPFALAILAEHAHALPPALGGRGGPVNAPTRDDGRCAPARGRRSCAATVCGRRRAGPRCRGSRRDAARRSRSFPAPARRHRALRAGRAGAPRIEIVQRAADHQRDDLVRRAPRRDAACRRCARRAAR